MNLISTRSLGFFAAALTFTSLAPLDAFASDIFVRDARGNMSRRQVAEVTSLVKNAVRNMPEHTLVRTASDADFVLQPSVIARGDEMVLRVEKQRDGEILSMSEEAINSVDSSKNRAMAVTETALQETSYGKSDSPAGGSDDDGATSSATTQSSDDMALDSESSASSEDAAVATDAPRASTRPAKSAQLAQAGPLEVQEVRRSNASTPAAESSNATNYSGTGVDSTARSPGADASVGELTSASPRMVNPDRAGQIQLGVGPAFGINMQNDSVMYDLIAAYAIDFSDNIVGKVFGDFNLATGSSNARFINLGVGADYFPNRDFLTFGKVYLGGDLGYAFTRDNSSRTEDNVAAGIGAGFKFQAAEMNWDVNAHYTLLLAQIADQNTPSVFGIRVALGF